MFCLAHAITGTIVDVAARTIYFDARLPDWLPEMRIQNLMVGQQAVDLRLWRDGDQSRVEVLKGGGVRVEHRPFAASFDHAVASA